jgi:hypothetical protein
LDSRTDATATAAVAFDFAAASLSCCLAVLRCGLTTSSPSSSVLEQLSLSKNSRFSATSFVTSVSIASVFVAAEEGVVLALVSVALFAFFLYSSSIRESAVQIGIARPLIC